jgi:chemotaxis protein methyltransferase CheR
MKGMSNQDIEIKLLLEAIYLKYDYDFRDYAKASIKRRILHRFALSQLETISSMQNRVIHDTAFFETLLQDLSINVTEMLDLSINVTEMFRDPFFYKVVRQEALGLLKKEPFVKIWHAGCATGEEVYSMSILLQEQGLVENIQIYATDISPEAIATAQKGIYPIDKMSGYITNYRKTGGTASFADYYTARYDFAIMHNSLKKNVLFSVHNLVTDNSFGEMDMIVCRNVLIYFSRELQNRVFGLFLDSLRPGGLLCLGSKESIRFSEHSDQFDDFDKKQKIYRKKGA